MMRFLLVFMGLLILPVLPGQEPSGQREGSISYITTQNVYIRFSSTDGIEGGDTLFILRGKDYVPVILVTNTSSISAVGTPLPGTNLKVGESLTALFRRKKGPDTANTGTAITVTGSDTGDASASPEGETRENNNTAGSGPEVHGRIAVSSYSNFSSSLDKPGRRMKYAFSMQADKLANSRLSAEAYLTFAHTNSNRENIKSDIFRGLKIYNVSLKYRFNETIFLLGGRKINPRLSSAGAIDGLQFEKSFGSLYLGAFGGSRPDYEDYGFNFNLLQYGGYIGYELAGENITMDNSAAFIEQTNHSMTDRRFVYFQHSSWLWKRLYLFASGEADLYRNVGGQQENVFNLSNLYLSVRYRFIRQLSAGLTYSSRKNVIYYETYKDFVERLIDNEALRGWNLRLNSRPVKNLSAGLSAGYRYRKEDPRPSRNVYGYVTYSRLPGIDASLTLSATWLESSILNGNIYSAGLSKDFLRGRASGGLRYRYVDYAYNYENLGLGQNVIEADLFFNIYRKLSLSVYYEGTFEVGREYHRIYLNCTQRF